MHYRRRRRRLSIFNEIDFQVIRSKILKNRMFYLEFMIIGVFGVSILIIKSIAWILNWFSNWMFSLVTNSCYLDYQTPYQWYNQDPRKNFTGHFLILRIRPNNSILLSRQLMTESQVLDYWYSQPILESEYQTLVANIWIFIRSPDLREYLNNSHEYYSIHNLPMNFSHTCHHYFWLNLIKCQEAFRKSFTKKGAPPRIFS